jgi:hypothetical protein
MIAKAGPAKRLIFRGVKNKRAIQVLPIFTDSSRAISNQLLVQVPTRRHGKNPGRFHKLSFGGTSFF